MPTDIHQYQMLTSMVILNLILGLLQPSCQYPARLLKFPGNHNWLKIMTDHRRKRKKSDTPTLQQRRFGGTGIETCPWNKGIVNAARPSLGTPAIIRIHQTGRNLQGTRAISLKGKAQHPCDKLAKQAAVRLEKSLVLDTTTSWHS